MSRLPQIFSPYRHSSQADFVALRDLLVDGVQLHRGDHLPVDSPIRQLPRRIETLCRRRHLEPVLETARPAQASIVQEQPENPSEPTAEDFTVEPEVDEFTKLTYAQLKKACKEHGVYAGGNREQLLTRLRESGT